VYVIPRLHDEANIEQTSSKRQANINQLEHTSYTFILNRLTFAWWLLDVCLMSVWSCKPDIKGPR